MKILTEHETIKRIINEKASIARFGDGELKLALGQKQMYEEPCEKLSNKLKTILKEQHNKLIIGIPRLNGNISKFWQRYNKKPYTTLYNQEITYGSAFITRPDMVVSINSAYWDIVRKIWQDKDIALFQGIGRDFESEPNLLDNASCITNIYGVRKNAFKNVKSYLQVLKNFSKRTVIILSLGPTATVLAYELTKAGYQALDLGHAGAFYNNSHPKSSGYQGEYYDNDKNDS